VGDVVSHRLFTVRGVVVGWDPRPVVDVSAWNGERPWRLVVCVGVVACAGVRPPPHTLGTSLGTSLEALPVDVSSFRSRPVRSCARLRNGAPFPCFF
jgi:hypothetical protein